MAKKHKCECPEPGLTAPFYMLTYGDMMTLLLTFFVLLFSMSTIQVVKFQAQVSAMKGALGISEMYQHAPMQQSLPAPSVKINQRITARAKTQSTPSRTIQDSAQDETEDSVQLKEDPKVRAILSLGDFGDLQITQSEDEIILLLPTFGLFNQGEYKVNQNSPEIARVAPLFTSLAKHIAYLSNYDVLFIGHTDALPVKLNEKKEGPKDNIELGFMRAVNVYKHFFKNIIKDKTRVLFASQGDNVPIVQNAKLDSERRKNRRVELRLRKKRPMRSVNI